MSNIDRIDWLNSEVYVVEGLYDDSFAIDYRKTTVNEKVKNGIPVFERDQQVMVCNDEENLPF